MGEAFQGVGVFVLLVQQGANGVHQDVQQHLLLGVGHGVGTLLCHFLDLPVVSDYLPNATLALFGALQHISQHLAHLHTGSLLLVAGGVEDGVVALLLLSG